MLDDAITERAQDAARGKPRGEILKYLKGRGERVDSEIAQATGIPLDKVRHAVSELAAAGDIIMCRLTRYENGKPLEGWLCRISGYVPPASPGRKPKSATPPPSN